MKKVRAAALMVEGDSVSATGDQPVDATRKCVFAVGY